MTRAALALFVLGACSSPIPPAARYPAGTGLEAHYVRVLGKRIRFIETGSGPPVIFIHGLGESVYAWRRNLGPVAAAGFRAIAFDNWGFGFSDKPDSGYGNADFTRLALGFMDALGLPDAVLVGHSMGGEIAAEVALAAPRRVRGLVLIDAAGMGIRAPIVLHLASMFPIEQLVLALKPRWAVTLALRSTYANPALIEPGDVDQYYAPVTDTGFAHALDQVLVRYRFDALRGRLGGLETSTLVIWGGHDRWIPPAFGARIAKELPRCAFLVVPTAGHAAQEEASARVNELLLIFLKEGVPQTPGNLALARQGP